MSASDGEAIEPAGSKYAAGVNRNARLVVRNVPWQATEDGLRKHFESYGRLEEVTLLRRPDGKLVGCGFVHFTHVPMANKALVATNKKQFMGRPLHVAWAVPKNKYEEKLSQGQGTASKKKNANKVSVSGEDEVIEVKEESDSKTKVKEEKAERLNRNARLIVRNVSFKATEESLREHFEPYGSVLEVKLLKKPDGKLVGCAFIHFKNVPMAKKALLNTNMKPFLGRPVSVDWAVAKDKYMQHVDRQRLELQEVVKEEREAGDGEEERGESSLPEDVKAEVKSESDDDSDDDEGSEDVEQDDEEMSDDEEDEDIPDDQSETSTVAERKRVQLNDAEDGCTVFVTNVPFSVESDQLRSFAERTAAVRYALVCVDKLTEHSRGTGFIKFLAREDAERFLALPPEALQLEGQTLQPRSALKRENLLGDKKKQPKDSRNLYLVKEGVIVAGTKAAVGVSASDMAKRLALERSKTQMLKNLNRFVSRYRLVVSNLPPSCDDGRLRQLCVAAAGKRADITEARVMRDLRAQPQPNGKHPSKGFGFVMFTRTEDALTCLRKLNNNPDIFDKNNRPIVSFSIEDRTALNARKKRLEKSIANNPLNKQQRDNRMSYNSRKRKLNQENPDESIVKKGKFEKPHKPGGKAVVNSQPGQFVRLQSGDSEDFTGLTAREGSQHNMRSNHKLKAQADIHKQNVKLEKKQSKKALKLKRAMKERIKQPKMKINKNPKGHKKVDVASKSPSKLKKDTSSFSDLVSKYKSKLVSSNKQDKVKEKWYE